MGRWRLRAPAALVGTLAAVSALMVWGASSATAGGPTSVLAQDQAPRVDTPDVALVVAGSSGRTTALHSGEPEFARFWELLQPTLAGTERVPEKWAEGRYPPVRVTVVWALKGVGGWPQTNRPPGGDIAVERQDQLFVAADGTPWVRSDPAPEVQDDDIRWHRAPRAVFGRLEQAGLLSGADATGDGGGSGPRSAPAAAPVWWAAAAGLAVGAGGTLLIRRAAARPGAGPPREEPRQELIDI